MADPSIPDTPDASTLPVSTANPAAVMGGGVQAAPPPTPPPLSKSSGIMGAAMHGIRHIANALEGKEVQYVPNAETGTYDEKVVPRKPGGFFRDVLMGAMIGGAAGASAPRGSGILGGLATGGAASIENQQKMDSRNKVRAEDRAKILKQNADVKAGQDKADGLAAQTVAQSTISMLDYGKGIDLHNPKQIDSVNKAGDTILDQAKGVGGTLPVIAGADGKDLNGQKGNGPLLMKKFNSDPQSVMRAPDGYHRIPIFHFDTTGMDHTPGEGYKKGDGKVDPNDHVTVSFIDVPNSSWNKSLKSTVGQVNTVAGAKIAEGKDDDPATTTFGGLYGLKLKNIQDLNNARREHLRPAKDEKEAEGWVAAGKTAADDPNMSDADKANAVFQAKKGQDFLDAHNKQQEQDNAAKAAGKEKDFPILKEGEVGGYIAKAQQELQTATTDDQRKQAQAKLTYGQSAARSLRSEASKLETDKKTASLRAEQLAANPGVADLGIKSTDTDEQILAKIPADYRETIKGITNYTIDPKTFTQRLYGKSGQSLDRAKSLNYVKLLDPTFDESQYNSRYKMRADYTSGKTAQNMRALNTAVQHLDQLHNSAEKLGNTDYPTLNAAKNFLSKQMGSSKVTNFTTDANAVAGELGQVFKGSGATDQEINSWKSQINPDMSKSQFDGFIQEGLDLMAGRLQAIGGQWEAGMGKPYDFKLINPQAREILSKLPGGSKVLDAMNISQGGASSSKNGQTVQPDFVFVPGKGLVPAKGQ